MPLLQLIKYDVMSAWHDYVRINCGNFKLDYLSTVSEKQRAKNNPQTSLLLGLTEDGAQKKLKSILNKLNVISLMRFQNTTKKVLLWNKNAPQFWVLFQNCGEFYVFYYLFE